MSVRNAEDLRCWQLADALRGDVIALCRSKQISHDVKFRTGFCDAAGSVCHNISEGFARFESPQIVQFFRYALASLAEMKDYFKESEERGLIDSAQLVRFLDRCEHTKATTLNFMKPHVSRAPRKRTPRRRK